MNKWECKNIYNLCKGSEHLTHNITIDASESEIYIYIFVNNIRITLWSQIKKNFLNNIHKLYERREIINELSKFKNFCSSAESMNKVLNQSGRYFPQI